MEEGRRGFSQIDPESPDVNFKWSLVSNTTEIQREDFRKGNKRDNFSTEEEKCAKCWTVLRGEVWRRAGSRGGQSGEGGSGGRKGGPQERCGERAVWLSGRGGRESKM